MRHYVVFLAIRLSELAISLFCIARLNAIEQLLNVEDPIRVLARSLDLLRNVLRGGIITKLVHSLSHLAFAAVFSTVEKAFWHLQVLRD